MTHAEYQAYLASREWAVKREAVRRRAGNRCERCRRHKMDACHHLTYERVGGAERLSDLQAICDPCHEYLSGKCSIDPAAQSSYSPLWVWLFIILVFAVGYMLEKG